MLTADNCTVKDFFDPAGLRELAALALGCGRDVVGPCGHNLTMIKRFAIAVSLAGVAAAMIGLAPPAHADPWCDPTNANYNDQLCMDEPQNNPACWGGDNAQCMRDWRHVATQPSPPGES